MNILQDKRAFALVCFLLIIFGNKAWANERLVYCIIYMNSEHASSVPSKTEIYTVDPETNNKKLVFSDEKTDIFLFHYFYAFQFPVVAGNKLFAHVLKRGESASSVGSNGSLYEISLDNTLRYRKITKVIGNSSLSHIFVNSSGTRIGYISSISGEKYKEYIFIFDVQTGKLLHQIDIDNFRHYNMLSIGYIPYTEKIYLSVGKGCQAGGELYPDVGTYTMQDDGKNLEKLSIVPNNDEGRMISILPTGEYLFETRAGRKKPKLYIVKDDYAHKMNVTFNSKTLCRGVVNYHLSPSGNYLSAYQLPVYSSPVLDIWVKDLNAGKEIKLFSMPTEGLKGPFLGVNGWIVGDKGEK